MSLIFFNLFLGEVLRGDRIVNTPYKTAMMVKKPCTVLCKRSLDKDAVNTLIQRIKDDYSVHL